MNTDRELLELAAKAAGLRIVDRSHPVTLYVESEGCKGGVRWNPLTDDGDAFRLAVKLELPIAHHGKRELFVQVLLRPGLCFYEPHGDDKNAATRRAIVRAAAEIGRQMQEGGAA